MALYVLKERQKMNFSRRFGCTCIYSANPIALVYLQNTHITPTFRLNCIILKTLYKTYIADKIPCIKYQVFIKFNPLPV